MASNRFVLQGIRAETHLNEIEWLFKVPEIKRVLIGVAFARAGGVEAIAHLLGDHHGVTTTYIGIRNEITSFQAARRLHELGVSLIAVDTATGATVFHPKIYVVRGSESARAIIGSANLTLGGLNNNIEASVAIELDLQNPEDRDFVGDIEGLFDGLVGSHPGHVFEISNVSEIETLQASGRLVDEMAGIPKTSPLGSSSSAASDTLPRIELAVRRLRSSVKRPLAGGGHTATVTTGPAVPPSGKLQRVWESKELTRRDLNIPDGTNTNATGSINLDKGTLDPVIDHRHYFYDEVFAANNWQPTGSPDVVETSIRARLLVKGIDKGIHTLRVAHTTSTTSVTYLQRNAMTRMSWGSTREYIAREDLIGRTLTLYRDQIAPTEFVIEID